MGKKKPKPRTSKPANCLETSSLSDTDKSHIEAIAAAICSANQAVFMKVCRLCEARDGPFLNIFDADKVTAKKIDELMPFAIAENDDLPHKICFRCSAKVEELYEFIQKCIKTQQNLNTKMGSKGAIQTKTRTRTIWEEKLHKSNLTNDDICNALIKKAMEGIKDIPLNPLPPEDEEAEPPKRITRHRIESPKLPVEKIKTEDNLKTSTSDDFDQKFIPTRSSRSQKNDSLLDGLPDYKKNKVTSKPSIEKLKEEPSPPKKKAVQISSDEEASSHNDDFVQNPPPTRRPRGPMRSQQEQPEQPKPVELSKPPEPPKPIEPPKPVEEAKPFDIMDHISTIKVHSVGVLFQCRLCNRNFLKKEMVTTHGCAKTGVPKVDFVKHIAPPEPPKISTIKYINTKIDGELGKPKVDKKTEETKPSVPPPRPKPRIGPASKVKRNHNSLIGMTVAPISEDVVPKEPPPKEPPPKILPKPVSKSPPETPTIVPSVRFPSVPSLNSRYKLVPGPNNTFQLVEENLGASTEIETPLKRQKNDDSIHVESKKSKPSEPSHRYKSANSQVVINLEDIEQPHMTKKSDEQPYPVGLFQTLPHHSSVYPATTSPEFPTFTTPAMKKQSYTIVQTGNPSKLLISTKPQPPVEEVVKKKVKKTKHEVRQQTAEPFNVTLEDTEHPKDHGFFNFINVDPLLQPSYVLPTDNIIQESQISTSTSVLKPALDNKDKDKYSCNMCGENFSREKKLLAHIHSHYNKMDEEDMLREKNSKKRRK